MEAKVRFDEQFAYIERLAGLTGADLQKTLTEGENETPGFRNAALRAIADLRDAVVRQAQRVGGDLSCGSGQN